MEHSVEVHKQIFFEEMGSLLKTKREELNLSVEYVVEELKFSKDIVHAMENAVVERLPNPVYAKGFYRAYATLLNIDQSIVDAFINTAFVDGGQEPVAPLLNIQMGSEKEENTFDTVVDKTHKRAQYRKILIALGMVALILILGCYIIFSGEKESVKEEPLTPQVPVVSIPLVQETPPVKQEEVAPPPVEEKIAPNPETVVKEEKPKSQKTTTTQKKSVVKSAQTTVEQTEAKKKDETTQEEKESVETNSLDKKEASVEATPPVVKEETKQASLRIVATGEVWVALKYDGKQKDFTLQQGQTHTVQFTGTLSVTIGDLSAAELYFGSKVMKNLGGKGKVKTYTFSANE